MSKSLDVLIPQEPCAISVFVRNPPPSTIRVNEVTVGLSLKFTYGVLFIAFDLAYKRTKLASTKIVLSA